MFTNIKIVFTCHAHTGLSTSRAFFVGDVNIFGINNRSVFVLGLQNGITVIWTILTHWDCIYLPNLAKEGARSATIITRTFAKFGEVDTVPVSENSLKYNTFC